jgi:acyl phosphate:glycerol-3-phosphate acyltransferase
MAPTLARVEQILAIVAAYLLGSVSFGVLVARTQGIDIHTVGSGNTGTSNVMRVLGKKLGAVVLVGDAGKGVLAAVIGGVVVDPAFGYVALLAAVIGHAFPVFHRFRGGKSVATTLGGLVYLAPVVGIVLTVMWAVILIIWKTASIGSIIVMILAVPLLALAGRRGSDLVWTTVIVVFVLFRHSGNIRRLVQHSERTIE